MTTEEPNSKLIEKPRLSIVHLMLWTACTAVLLAVVQQIERLTRFPEVGGVDARISWALVCLVQGPAVASLVVLIVRRRRRIDFPTEPGEWLLVASGVGVAFELTIQLAVYATYDFLTDPFGYGMLGCAYAAGGLAYLLPLRALRGKWIWQVVLVALATSNLLLAAACWVHSWFWVAPILAWYSLHERFTVLSSVAILCILPATLIRDRRRHIDRGWMHVVGVATLIAQLLLFLSQWLYYSFATP